MPDKILLQNQLPVGTPQLWLYAKFNLALLQAAAAPCTQPLVLAVLFLCPQSLSQGDFHSDQTLHSSHWFTTANFRDSLRKAQKKMVEGLIFASAA